MTIERIVRHPDFDRTGNTENDIALLRLSRPVTLSESVQPVILPADERAVANALAVSDLRCVLKRSYHYLTSA